MSICSLQIWRQTTKTWNTEKKRFRTKTSLSMFLLTHHDCETKSSKFAKNQFCIQILFGTTFRWGMIYHGTIEHISWAFWWQRFSEQVPYEYSTGQSLQSLAKKSISFVKITLANTKPDNNSNPYPNLWTEWVEFSYFSNLSTKMYNPYGDVLQPNETCVILRD